MPTHEPGLGGVWMLGTDALLEIPRELMVESPRWIDFLNTIYPTLSNFVDERNEVSMRWLDLMGFEFPYEDDFITHEGVVFRRFYRCATPSASPSS